MTPASLSTRYAMGLPSVPIKRMKLVAMVSEIVTNLISSVLRGYILSFLYCDQFEKDILY